MTEQMNESDVEQSGARKEKLRVIFTRFGGVIFALAITVGIWAFHDQLQAVEKYGYLGIFLISIIGNATIVLPVPTFVVAFAGGAAFESTIAVAIIAAAGATLGEMTGYLAGTSGKAIVENRDMYERFNAWMQRYGLVRCLSWPPSPILFLMWPALLRECRKFQCQPTCS